jgi:hypothetical protein
MWTPANPQERWIQEAKRLTTASQWTSLRAPKWNDQLLSQHVAIQTATRSAAPLDNYWHTTHLSPTQKK